MDKKKLDGLDMSLLQTRKSKVISTKDSLKDEEPIIWSKEVIEGKKKIKIGMAN